MDFTRNPIGNKSMEYFAFSSLEPEAYQYLKNADALQSTPIERLETMNPPAIEIYKEHNIDLYNEPLEIAVCAQHNNGGFAVNKWWQSNIENTFIIGEMAGTHGIKRPGGAALNAGQVGAIRAAEYIANNLSTQIPDYSNHKNEMEKSIRKLKDKFNQWQSSTEKTLEILNQIQTIMTDSGGHIRKLETAQKSLKQATTIFKNIQKSGLKIKPDLISALQTEHITVTGIAFLKAIVELLKLNSGSRGSHLVISEDGTEIHPNVTDENGDILKFKQENTELRNSIQQILFNESADKLFQCRQIPVRKALGNGKSFESGWEDFRQGKIYEQ
jgi:succinate dehydrogenase/fumarate reductase flavoprotein subunit